MLTILQSSVTLLKIFKSELQPVRLHLNPMTFMQMSAKPKSRSQVQNIIKFYRVIQSTLVLYITLVLLLTPFYALWVNCKFMESVQEQLIILLTNRNFMCREYLREVVPAAIASFKEYNIGNDSSQVESTFKYLGDTIG